MKIIKIYPERSAKFLFGFGSTEDNDIIFHSDSLAGALASNLSLRGADESGIINFIDKMPAISSLFIGSKGIEGEIFLPRPRNLSIDCKESSERRKINKKCVFISLGVYSEYLSKGKVLIEDIITDESDTFAVLNKEVKGKERIQKPFYGEYSENTTISRAYGSTGEEGSLYSISSICLEKDAYFYFLLDGDISDEMKKAIEDIKINGIGGKRSVGFGRIADIKTEDFSQLKDLNGDGHFMAISLVVPEKEEIEKSESYTLIKRSGFADNLPFKRKSVFCLGEGSIFKEKVPGRIVDLGEVKKAGEEINIKGYYRAFLLPAKEASK